MKNLLYSLVFALLIISSCNNKMNKENSESFPGKQMRAPAYPLITVDPYMSAWSTSDNLFDKPVKHWTGETHSLIGAVKVDDQVYRFLGKEEIPWNVIIPMANFNPWPAKYILSEPGINWTANDFDDAAWENGKGAFGTSGMPSLSTKWETEDIWVRREFSLSDFEAGKEVYLIYSHDDIFELYLNGTRLVDTEYEWHNDVVLKINPTLLNSNGNNVIAAHCHNRTGGGYVDFGLFQESSQKEVFSRVAVQDSVKISATQTKYTFACGPVDLNLTFVSPLLPDNLDLLSRPVNYVNYSVVSNDDQNHNVQLYFETTPEWAVNETGQEVTVSVGSVDDVSYIKTGTVEQPVLKKKGDNVRIDWGYFYMAAKGKSNAEMGIGDYFEAKKAFVNNNNNWSVGQNITAKMSKNMPAMVFTDDLNEVSAEEKSGYIMLGYDDLESIQYFGDNLKAWWTKNGDVTFQDVLLSASNNNQDIISQCNAFDLKLFDEAVAAGGENYAKLCMLAFRQSVAAHKLVKDKKGEILFLSKENFSNGSIGTVDVTYPSAPLYLKYNPDLLKGMLNPIFYYTESGKWTKPFAAHDVGTYPIANGQTYGGDMPVEESGNMLILTAAIAEAEGNASYAEKHWEALTTWANYLLENGLDPENQLCTDDFAGHFAHNANLSVKAIMGIASYGKLAEMLGKNELAEKYILEAKRMAKEWMQMADDGDHYRLTFDKPGTWSQKYNLVWNKLLRLDIFPKEVAQKEIAFYLNHQNDYGLPLDNRATYTKSDWIVWTATLAENQETFQKFIDPLYKYVTETPDRVPMSDWYQTTDATKVGFQARSVVGGYFIKMLENSK